MTSRIEKQYLSGFSVTPSSLRSLVREISDLSGGEHSDMKTSFIVHSDDGRLIVRESVEEVIGHDNAGPSRIRKLQLCASKDDNLLKDISRTTYPMLIGRYHDDDILYIAFNGRQDISNSSDIEMLVYSTDDNFAIASATRIDGKMKDMECNRAIKNLHSEGFAIKSILVVLIVILGLLWLDRYFPQPNYREMYGSGRFKDAIDFMLFRDESNLGLTKRAFPIIALIFLASIVLANRLVAGARWLFPLRVFAWGGGERLQENRKTVKSILFVVVVLGLIVSIASNWLSLKMFTM